jgi:hypothetical protein
MRHVCCAFLFFVAHTAVCSGFDTGLHHVQLESLTRCLSADTDCTTWVNEEGKATDRKDDLKETRGYRTAFVRQSLSLLDLIVNNKNVNACLADR